MSEDYETFLKENKIEAKEAQKWFIENWKAPEEEAEGEAAAEEPAPKPKPKTKAQIEKDQLAAFDKAVKEKVKEELKVIRGSAPKGKKVSPGDKDYPDIGKHGIHVPDPYKPK